MRDDLPPSTQRPLRRAVPAGLLLLLAAPAAPIPADERAEAFLRAVEPVRQDVSVFAAGYRDRVYTRAFALLDVDVDALEPEQAAAAIGRGPLGRRAAAALDDWARACVSLGSKHYLRSGRRHALALALDDDPVRSELRRAFLEAGLTEVHALAVELAERTLDPPTARYVADTLAYAEERELAVTTLLAAVERAPDDFDLRLAAAHHLTGTRRADEALPHLARARLLDPRSPWPLVELGRAHSVAGRRAEAVAACRLALTLAPDFFPAYRVIASAARGGEGREQALEAYRAMLRLEPEDDYLHNALAWQLAMGRDEELRAPEEALRHAERAVALDPEEVGYLNTLGVCLYRVGRFDRCVEVLEESTARQMDGGEPSDYWFLAMAWQQLGEPEIARELYEKGVEVSERGTGRRRFSGRGGELGRIREEAAALLGIG